MTNVYDVMDVPEQELPTNPKMTDDVEGGDECGVRDKTEPLSETARDPVVEPKSNRGPWIVATFFLVLIAGLVVGLVLGLKDDNSTTRQVDNLDNNPTQTPQTTQQPTPSPNVNAITDTPTLSPTETPSVVMTTESPTPDASIVPNNADPVLPPLMVNATTGEPIPFVYDVTDSCANVVTALKALQLGLGLPEHLVDTANHGKDDYMEPVVQPSDFNVSDYFDALDFITEAPEMTLDYVYYFDGMEGSPLLYARNESDAPFQNLTEYKEACVSEMACSYLYALSVENSTLPQSFMELVALEVMGDQFYQYWHGLFNDHQIVYNNETLMEIYQQHSNNNSTFGNALTRDGPLYSLDEDDLAVLQALNLASLVELDPDRSHVNVTVILFTKWGGFFRATYAIVQGDEEGEIIKVEQVVYDNLVPFVTGNLL